MTQAVSQGHRLAPPAQEVHLEKALDEDDKPLDASDDGDRSGSGAGQFGP